MAEANRDQNHVPVALGQSNTSASTTLPFQIDSTTGRLLTDTPSGSGDVVGPASSTNNAIARFDGVTGKLIQNSVVIVSDTGDITGAKSLNLSDLTASELIATDGSKNIVSLPVATYPSLTELSYVKGVTSAIQTQLNAKQATGNYITALTGDVTASGPGSVAATIADDAVTLAKMASGTAGNLITYDAAGNPAAVATGTANQVLTSNGAGAAPTFQDASGGGANTALSNLAAVAINTSLISDTDNTDDLGSAAIKWANLFITTIGATATRVVKGWFTDLEVTNAIVGSITGNAATVTTNANLTGVVTSTGNATAIADAALTIAKTSGLQAALDLKAPLASPTFTGIVQLAEGASISLDQTLSGDGQYSGITIAGTAGATLAFGDLVYLAVADSRWELADADAATTSDRMLGMCVLAAASDGSATRILLVGNIRAATLPTLTVGAPVYVGETAGDVQLTIPTGADNVIRRVGYGLSAEDLYFNPSMDSQTTVA